MFDQCWSIGYQKLGGPADQYTTPPPPLSIFVTRTVRLPPPPFSNYVKEMEGPLDLSGASCARCRE